MAMVTAGHTSRRVLPPVYFLGALMLMFGLHLLLPGPQLVQSPLRYGGLLFVAAGVAVLLWAAGLFRQDGTTINPFQEASTLVVRGPYRLTRNPMYVGMAFVLLGIGLLLGSAFPFAVVLGFVLLIDLRFIRAEEMALERAFGAAYSAYKARVRRWL